MKLSPIFKSTLLLFPLILPSHGDNKVDTKSPSHSYAQSAPLLSSVPKPKNQFHESIIEKLNELAKEHKFFKLVLDAANKKNYEFLLYSEGAPIPEDIKECMSLKICLAMTFKDRKRVYLKEQLLVTGNEKKFLGALTNEGLHIILDPTDTLEEAGEVFGRDVTSEEVVDETKLFKEGKVTVSEKIFHDVLNEEVLSQVVEDIILEKYENESYKLSEENIRSGAYSSRIFQIGAEYGIHAFARVFDLIQFEESDYGFILRKVNEHARSDELKNYLTLKLKEFELLE
jgi:hypothetical protein